MKAWLTPQGRFFKAGAIRGLEEAWALHPASMPSRARLFIHRRGLLLLPLLLPPLPLLLLLPPLLLGCCCCCCRRCRAADAAAVLLPLLLLQLLLLLLPPLLPPLLPQRSQQAASGLRQRHARRCAPIRSSPPPRVLPRPCFGLPLAAESEAPRLLATASAKPA
jgi:hypothetical protein